MINSISNDLAKLFLDWIALNKLRSWMNYAAEWATHELRSWMSYTWATQLSERLFRLSWMRIAFSAELNNVESYWLTKEWIATAVYLKWMRNSAYYIKNLSHSSIYWSFIFWFIEIHLRIEIFVCHENFFFWSSYLRFSLSLRSDLIRIAYSSSNSLISRRFRKSVNLKEIISIEWL
jgi:hypothetical protein